jgi:hypothetical protein
MFFPEFFSNFLRFPEFPEQNWNSLRFPEFPESRHPELYGYKIINRTKLPLSILNEVQE